MSTEEENSSIVNKTLLSIAMIIVVIVIILNVYLWKKEIEPESESTSMEINQGEVTEKSSELHGNIEEPEVKYPVPDELKLPVETTDSGKENETIPEQPVTEKKPLPALDESDQSLKDSLAGILSPEKPDDLFILNSFIRHFVVTIDNMTGKKLPQRYVFTRKPAGKFMVKKQDEEDSIWLDERNFNRYSPFVAMTNTLDTRQFVALYVKYYPLFQQAYQDLGYPGRHFNDRLVEVIDHLLATPGITGPIRLLRPKVFYTFADPQLERLSAGQKILVRIGPENAKKVKAKLKELKQQLTNLQ